MVGALVTPRDHEESPVYAHASRRLPGMRRAGSSTRFLIGGLASAGVVLAHAVAYRLVAPDPHVRYDLLESTGHRYWTVLATIALGLLTAGMANFLARRLSDPEGHPGLNQVAVVWRLALLQSVGFLGLEFVERLGMQQALAAVFAEPVMLIGLVIQIVAAFLGAALLWVLTRAIDNLIKRREADGSVAATVVFGPAELAIEPRFTLATGGPTWRGPPVTA